MSAITGKNNLRELRVARKLTMRKLGELMGGVHFTTIQKLENSSRKLNLDWAERFAIAFDVMITDIEGVEEPPQPDLSVVPTSTLAAELMRRDPRGAQMLGWPPAAPALSGPVQRIVRRGHRFCLISARSQEPCTRSKFADVIIQPLTLVCGGGWPDKPTAERIVDSAEWLEAAWGVLEDIPLDLLRRGCKAAMHSVDHPSKIVPAIIAAIGEEWDAREEQVAEQGDPAVAAVGGPAGLAKRIQARLTHLGVSERGASLAATGQPDTIRFIRTRAVMPSADRLLKIATVLQTTPTYLLRGEMEGKA